MARRQLQELFDSVAASFGAEMFDTRQLTERIQKREPKLTVESWMLSKWIARRIAKQTLAITGSGPRRSVLYQIKGPSGVTAVEPKPVAEKKSADKYFGRGTLRPMLSTWFPAPSSFNTAEVVAKAKKQWPDEPSSRVLFTVSQMLASDANNGLLINTTPHKQTHRRFRLPDSPSQTAVSVPVVQAEEETESLESTAPATPSQIAAIEQPTSAVDSAVAGLCGLFDEFLDQLVRVMRESVADLMAEMGRKLEESRIARLESLATSMPEFPRLFQLVQEMKKPSTSGGNGNANGNGSLPRQLANHTLTYHKGFEAVVTALPKHEQELVKKAITLLVCNGEHYPSLHTGKLDREIPNAPHGCYKSRAGDLRFAWRRQGKGFEFYTLFRRGDAPTVYGSE